MLKNKNYYLDIKHIFETKHFKLSLRLDLRSTPIFTQVLHPCQRHEVFLEVIDFINDRNIINNEVAYLFVSKCFSQRDCTDLMNAFTDFNNENYKIIKGLRSIIVSRNNINILF